MAKREPAGCPVSLPVAKREPAGCRVSLPVEQREPAGCPVRLPVEQREPAGCRVSLPVEQREPAGCRVSLPVEQREPAGCPVSLPVAKRKAAGCHRSLPVDLFGLSKALPLLAKRRKLLTAMRMVLRAVVGFGANLGDRLETMRRALKELERVARIDATSHVFSTAPVGPPQPDYLNAAALVTWDGSPDSLLEALLGIEASLGRVRAERFGPRTIDLDVLWIEGLAVESETLTVPHPRLKERAFALVPMLEVVPGARDPRTGEAYVAPAGGVERTEDVL